MVSKGSMSVSIKLSDSTSEIPCDSSSWIFSLQANVSSVSQYGISIGFTLKDTDVHGFGHILGFPSTLKEILCLFVELLTFRLLSFVFRSCTACAIS